MELNGLSIVGSSKRGGSVVGICIIVWGRLYGVEEAEGGWN